MGYAEWGAAVAAADRIEIYLSGMVDGAPASTEVMVAVTGPEELQDLAERLAITDGEIPASGPGHVTLRLFGGDEVLETVALHHGEAIRGQDWTQAAPIARPPRLIAWLARNGVSLAARAAAMLKEQREKVGSERQGWIDAIPRSLAVLAPHLVATDMAGSVPERLIDETESTLAGGIPDDRERCVALLTWHSKGTCRLSGHPVHEEVPNLLLQRLPLSLIVESLDASDATRLGAARHFGSRARTREELGTLDAGVGEALAAAADAAGRQGIAEEVRRRFGV